MGFLELLVVAIVGLLVVGPDKLPGALKSGARWFAKIKRTMQTTRTEIEKQIGMDEIRRELHNEQIMENLAAMKAAKEETEKNVNLYASSLNPLNADTLPNSHYDEDEGNFGNQHGNHSQQDHTIPTNEDPAHSDSNHSDDSDSNPVSTTINSEPASSESTQKTDSNNP